MNEKKISHEERICFSTSRHPFSVSAIFPPEDLSVVLSRLKLLNIKKDDCLIREGQISQTFYYINTGSFRHYTIQDNGKEATINLFVPNDWFCENKSFVTQKPSLHIIRAVNRSEIFALSVGDFHELVKISDRYFSPTEKLQNKANNY